MDLKEQLRRDEGCKSTVYFDTKGIPTVGVGRNLQNPGLSDDEIDYLLTNDVKKRFEALSGYKWFMGLDEVRRAAILNMSFMGVDKLLGFHDMIYHLSRGEWNEASMAAVDSQWAKDVGPGRSGRIAQQIQSGEWV